MFSQNFTCFGAAIPQEGESVIYYLHWCLLQFLMCLRMLSTVQYKRSSYFSFSPQYQTLHIHLVRETEWLETRNLKVTQKDLWSGLLVWLCPLYPKSTNSTDSKGEHGVWTLNIRTTVSEWWWVFNWLCAHQSSVHFCVEFMCTVTFQGKENASLPPFLHPPPSFLLFLSFPLILSLSLSTSVSLLGPMEIFIQILAM